MQTRIHAARGAATDDAAEMQALVERIDEVAGFPEIARRVLEVVNDPDSSIADLRSVVECDPVLVSRLLRTVNSAAYALHSEVDSIDRAIALLGFTEVKNLAGTASVSDLLVNDNIVGRYSSTGLWRHLVSVAVTARLIASRCGLPRFEEAYMCGLVHDLGLMVLDQHVEEGFAEIILGTSKDTPTASVERELLGFDHTELGAALASKWGFPRCVVDSVRHHHSAETCDGEDVQIVRVVEVANFLCTRKGITSAGVQNVKPPSGQTFSALQIGRNDLQVLWSDIDPELAKVDDLLGV